MVASSIPLRLAELAGELQEIIDKAARSPASTPLDFRRRYDLLENLALARDRVTIAGRVCHETYTVHKIDAQPEVFAEVPPC